MPNYPTSLDNTTSLPSRSTGNSIPATDSNDKNTVLISIESKLGIGSSVAGSATTGQVLAKNGDGTTSWQTISGGGSVSPATFTTAGTVKQREYNAKDYSVTGNGTTDDTAAINALITTVSTSGGGTIFFPKGTYKINTAEGINPANYVNIVGAGRGITVFLPYATNPAFKYVGTTGTPLVGANFSDFTIDGSNQTLGGGSYTSFIKGFYFTYLQRCTFERLHVMNTGSTAVGNDFHRDCTYRDLLVENGGRLGSAAAPGAAGIGIGVSSWCTGAKFIGCVTRNNMRAGIFFETQNTTRGVGYIVMGHVSESNGDCGIGDAGCDGLQVIGGVFKNNTKAGITSYTGTIGAGRVGTNAQFIGCDVFGNGTSGYVAVEDALSNGAGNRFINCKFYSNTQYGMIYASQYDIADVGIFDSEVYLNGFAGIKFTTNTGTFNRLTIRNNRIYNNGITVSTDRYGIFLAGGMATGSISGNMIFDSQSTRTQQYAIAFASGVSIGSGAWQMRDNDFRSNLVGPYLDSGASIGAPAVFANNLAMDLPTAKSSAYAILAYDRNNTFTVTGSTTLTLPTAVSRSGFRVTIVKTDSPNTTTIATTSSQTINGATTQTLTVQYQAITVESDGANWTIINKA